MKNWQTTVSGCVTACLMALAQVPGLAEYKTTLESAASLFLAIFALTAKDHNVTGGSK